MAATTALVLGGMAALGAGASIYGGIQAQNEAKKQAERANQQAAIAAAETDRQTKRSAELEQREIDKTESRQRLAYLASGVTLSGSPLLKLEETRRLGAENIEEIEKAGKAASAAQIAEGRTTAQAAKARGRQALIGGITGAIRSGTSVAGAL